MKEFLSALIVRDKDTNIFYNGDSKQLANVLDSAFADLRYEKNKNHITFHTIQFNMYWKIERITVPVFLDTLEIDENNSEDVTIEFKKNIMSLQKRGLISDKKWSTMNKIMEHFHVYKSEEFIAFCEIDKSKSADAANTVYQIMSTKDELVIDQSTIKLDIEQQSDIGRYENAILLLKEVKDWYYDVRKHSLAEKQGKRMVQHEYKLWRDVYLKLNTKTKEIVEMQQQETAYEWAKEKSGRYITTPDGEKVDTKDFLPYMTKEDGDILEVRLVWAYTHILRDMLDFKPLAWQYKFLINFNRINFLAWCRRSWKTRVAAYFITRELWKMPNSVKHVQRQGKTLYIAPTDDKLKEVVDYIKTTSERIRILKVIDFNKKENRLYLFDEVVSRNMKTQLIVATCDFASGKGFEPGRGKASDLVFIDEAAFIPEDVRLNILPIIENEKARFIGISTIDWNTARNRFYENLIEAEQWYDKDMYWLRVTIDDIDSVLIDDISKERMKRALKHSPERYYAELYATFPDMKQVFQTEGFYNIDKNYGKDAILEVIIGYDPAKRTDTWAIIVWFVTQTPRWGTRLDFVEEYGLQWEFTAQREFVANLKQWFIRDWYKTTVIIDATAAWDVVAEIFGSVVDYKIWYTSKGQRPTVDNYGAWKVPKNNLIHMSQILIEKQYIKAWVGLKKLMEELKYFKQISTNAGWFRYEAEIWHDDYVNAMLLAWFYYWFMSGRIHDVTAEMNLIKRGPWIEQVTWLYPSITSRWSITMKKKWPKGFSF